MRKIWHQVRKPINTGSGDLKRHAFLHFVDDGKIALHLAKEYEIDLGARSLASAVEQDVRRVFSEAFNQNDSEVTDEMNHGPLENYEVRLASELEGDSVVVERVGFRSMKQGNWGTSL